MIGEAVFALVVVLLDVPSGWLSDIWNRKYVLGLGSIFELAGFAILLAADNLAMAITAQAVIGIAISLYSGTNSALLYDSLLEIGREKEFGTLEGRRNGFGLYGIGAASVIGGILYTFDHNLPIYATIVSIITAGLASLLMTEPERHKSAVQGHPLEDMSSTMRYAIHGHMEVGLILLFSSALFCATKLNMWIQQPYYMELEILEAWFGVLMAAGYVTGGLASHFSHLMFKRTSNIIALAVVWGIAVIACLGSAVHVGYHGIVLLMLGGSFIFGAAFPRVREAINVRVSSERRATIISTSSFLQQIIFIPLGLLIGALSDAYGVAVSLYGVAAWLVASGVLLIAWAIHKNKSHLAANVQ